MPIPVGAHVAQVDAARHGRRHDARLTLAHGHGQGVEIGLRLGLEPAGLKGRPQPRGLAVHAFGDGPQPERPVEHRIETGDDGQKRLRRAHVRGRLFAAYMLLPRLQRQPVGLLPEAVHRHADDPTGQGTLHRVATGNKGGMRPAIAQRHAENAAPTPRRYRHPSRPAPGSASAPEDQWRRSPPPFRHGAPRSRWKHRADAHRCPDTGKSRRTRPWDPDPPARPR